MGEREKKVRKKKEKREQRGSWNGIRKMSGPRHLESRLGLYLDCHDLQ